MFNLAESSSFRVISLIVAAFIGIAGIAAFAKQGRNSQNNKAEWVELILWGYQPKDFMNSLVYKANEQLQGFYITYEEKPIETYEEDFIEALASGEGPDLFITTGDLAFKHSNKFNLLSYESFPPSAFTTAFVPASEVFLQQEGISSLPIVVDPLVLFFNETLLTSQFIQTPPGTWKELAEMIPSIRFINETDNSIIQSAIALGSADNIVHSKDILAAMFLQTENPIVTYTLVPSIEDQEKKQRMYESSLGKNFSSHTGENALTFFGSFSSLDQSHYTWNTSMPEDREAFLAGDLVFYFGKASEYEDLILRNPNLDIGISLIPQVDERKRYTYADVIGVSVVRSTQYPVQAQSAMLSLASDLAAVDMYKDYNKIPARRSSLDSIVPETDNDSARINSGIISSSWMDPDPAETKKLFLNAIRSLRSGNTNSRDILFELDMKIDTILKDGV